MEPERPCAKVTANCVPAAIAVQSVSRKSPMARNKLRTDGRGATGRYLGGAASCHARSSGIVSGAEAGAMLFTRSPDYPSEAQVSTAQKLGGMPASGISRLWFALPEDFPCQWLTLPSSRN